MSYFKDIKEELDRYLERQKVSFENLEKLENTLDESRGTDDEHYIERSLEFEIAKSINILSRELTLIKELKQDYRVRIVSDDDIANIEIIPLEDGYKFILPCLLNKREQFEVYKDSRKYARQCFEEAFSNYDKTKHFKRLTDVSITYINYFTEKRLFIDNDNIDTKHFTDCIVNYIIGDDNISILKETTVRGEIGDYNHTEVIVKRFM